jgi:hypothetical protein
MFASSNQGLYRFWNRRYKNLKSQIVTSKIEDKKIGRGGIRKLPFAFTEQGVAMLSSVLKSEIAIQVNIQIIRVYTRLHQFLLNNESGQKRRRDTGHF